MIKETQQIPPEKIPPYETIPFQKRPSAFLKLNRNLAFLMLLMVCLASIYNHQLPDGQTVLTAIQSTVDDDWDESLGKITFVDNILPETLAVFFADDQTPALSLPCNGSLSHLWETHAPYISFIPASPDIWAVADGEVMSLSSGAGEDLTLRIRHEQGLETVYYHLSHVAVQEGDEVSAGDTIGQVASGHNLVLDVRKNGLSVNPTAFFAAASP